MKERIKKSRGYPYPKLKQRSFRWIVNDDSLTFGGPLPLHMPKEDCGGEGEFQMEITF